jgi:hypothetical protein
MMHLVGRACLQLRLVLAFARDLLCFYIVSGQLVISDIIDEHLCPCRADRWNLDVRSQSTGGSIIFLFD